MSKNTPLQKWYKISTLIFGDIKTTFCVKRGKTEMKVNIVADFKENGMDKNELHIVSGADEMVAGYTVMRKLQAQGCDVQMLTVIDGDWSLKELRDITNYGMYRDEVQSRVIYLSEETRAYLERVRNDPEEAKRLKDELVERLKRWTV